MSNDTLDPKKNNIDMCVNRRVSFIGSINIAIIIWSRVTILENLQEGIVAFLII